MIAPSNILDHLNALADPTRTRLLLLLDRNELTVGELCAVLQLPQSTASRHLRILADEGWLVSRGEGTSRYYSMVSGRLEPPARRLWQVVRDQMTQAPGAAQDRRRLESVLAERRTRSQAFFSRAAGVWDNVRSEMIGQRTDLLALLDLLDESWVVGDLGCGTGHATAALAPSVGRVIAVDESGAMLAAARKRLASHDNVELRSGKLEQLPIEDGELDAAMMLLVAQFIPDPPAVLAEARRVLKPGGKLLMLDLMPHDRTDYAVQLGHVWPGFGAEQITEWMTQAGFESCRYRPLPVDSAARGPALFSASGRTSAAQKRARKRKSS